MRYNQWRSPNPFSVDGNQEQATPSVPDLQAKNGAIEMENVDSTIGTFMDKFPEHGQCDDILTNVSEHTEGTESLTPTCSVENTLYQGLKIIFVRHFNEEHNVGQYVYFF